MSNYVKSTNFTSKDSLASGNPLKIVKGSEIDTEFNNIATAVATKADSTSATLTSPTLTTPTITTPTITNGTITGTTLSSLGADIAVADGGTGASTASGARTNLGAAASGANSDITSLSGLTTALSVAQGGTGATTLTANNVLIGNGTSAVQSVAPGSSGNILKSNGTSWTSVALTLSEIGVSQTWTDVTSSRAVNTTYTNSTGKPIMVAITISTGGGTVVVDGVSVLGISSANQNTTTSTTFIVQNSSTYRYNGSGLSTWVELR